MRIKILPVVFLVLFAVMCGDDSPTQDAVKKKKGNLVITVDSTPLLMNWNYSVMKRFLDGGYFKPSHLKQYREDRGWSQKVMAMHLEMPQQKVSDMEKGRKPLNQKVIGRLKRCDLWHYKWENLDKYKQTYVPPKKGYKNGLQTKELGGRKSAKKGNPLLFLDPMDSKGKCARCGGYFHDFEMTIDDSFVARPICENCTDEKNHS